MASERIEIRVNVQGYEKLVRLGIALRHADPKIKRAARSSIAKAAKPLRDRTRVSASRTLPSGYRGQFVRHWSVRSSIRMSRNPGITLTGRGRTTRARGYRHVVAIDRGILRHPLFGNREFWYNTTVRPEFWTRVMRGSGPEIRRDILRALNEVARDLARLAR